MHDIVAQPCGGQAAASLAEHAAEIRRLGKRVVGDVIEIGRRLIECQKLIPHGGWLPWLDAELGWSQSTALNFMRVCQLALSKNANFADLNLPVSALYLLAAPSTPADVQDEIIERAGAGEIVKVVDVKNAIEARKRPTGKAIETPKAETATIETTKTRTSHLEILAPWDNASPEVRTRAVNSIGLTAWLAAIPNDWWPLIERHIANRHQMDVTVSADPPPDDLSIPTSFRRDSKITVEADEQDEVEEDDEPELEKPKRKPPKLIVYSQSIAEAIDCVFSDLGELGCECREVVDTAPENFQQTERIQALEAAADELENLEALEVPEVLSKIPVKYSLPRRRYVSRAARASDAEAILTACQRAVEVIADDDDRHADARTLIDDLQSAIDTLGQCEFPGAFQ